MNAQKSRMTDDLQFVRGVVERAERTAVPAAVFWIWAALVLVGFPLPDFVSGTIVFRYWIIAGPAGFVVCAFLAQRHARVVGQEDARAGRMHLMHWGIVLGVAALAVALPARGLMEWRALGPLTLLIVALGYVTAGVDVDRRYLWPGGAMLVGYGLLLLPVAFAWTIIGVLVASGLALSAWITGHPRVA